MTRHGEQSGVLVGNDALNMMINVYMDGFTTGASSALASYTQAEDAMADTLVDLLTDGIREDPLAVETIRREIAERFAGIDTGPKSFSLPPANRTGEQP